MAHLLHLPENSKDRAHLLLQFHLITRARRSQGRLSGARQLGHKAAPGAATCPRSCRS
ncbi:hypothetical protein HanXRQr2_Chr15g0713611 [Helianthus annuus]|uniref:Uncharacterized protein n=1 Tax=Helianthus annuus TaxID=4232 RepID=A0A251SBJ7_HELAN|nr:hypothetical protein HanXRQr2_Chr15g0713611 [Helianthus annuus]KAJ0832966.1 hypothetical protein HanPSC8_Chr15g0684801 [Helianthus annuus]